MSSLGFRLSALFFFFLFCTDCCYCHPKSIMSQTELGFLKWALSFNFSGALPFYLSPMSERREMSPFSIKPLYLVNHQDFSSNASFSPSFSYRGWAPLDLDLLVFSICSTAPHARGGLHNTLSWTPPDFDKTPLSFPRSKAQQFVTAAAACQRQKLRMGSQQWYR